MKESSGFVLGADLGWLTQLEEKGIRWVNENNEEKDVLELLKEKNINCIRLRVFVNPSEEFIWKKRNGMTCYLGYSNVDELLKMAQRVQQANLELMVDFHYSDYFADPEYQDAPYDWNGNSFDRILMNVYEHTKTTLQQLRELNIIPKWVQVGNEINNGMVYPYGDTKDHWKQFVELLNKGYDAVKDFDPNVQVITHIANGQDEEECHFFFQQFLDKYQGKTDIIGLSYYPYWCNKSCGETIGALTSNMISLYKTFHKPIMICEVGGDELEELASYDLVKNTINAVKSIPNHMGLGVIYWEPEGRDRKSVV